MKQRNFTTKMGSLYLLACLILLLGFSPFTVAHAAPDSPASYQVVFDPEDGSSYNDWYKVAVPEGGKITDQPANPQKEGFIFEGWAYAYDESGSPVLWNFETDVVSENTTLWAVWGKAYQVVFDPEDGTGYSDWYKVTVPEGGKITDQPADPQKEGFIFEGWAYAYDEDGSPVLWNFETDVVSENTTLWAVWENGTIVAFDPDDGTTEYPDFYKTVVKPGSKVTDIPADPQREGYVFGGWAYAYDENGKPLLWDFNRPVGDENMTLWAVWNKAYLVVFDPENGTEYKDWFKLTVPEGGKITGKPDNPVKDGYVFNGWYSHLDADDKPVYWNFDEDVVTGNMTLWASWSKEDNGNHAAGGNGTAGANNNGAGNIQDKADTSGKNPTTGNEGRYFLGLLAVLGVLSFGTLALLKNQS